MRTNTIAFKFMSVIIQTIRLHFWFISFVQYSDYFLINLLEKMKSYMISGEWFIIINLYFYSILQVYVKHFYNFFQIGFRLRFSNNFLLNLYCFWNTFCPIYQKCWTLSYYFAEKRNYIISNYFQTVQSKVFYNTFKKLFQ